MAVAPTYPGVYIEEIPSGVRTITGVATSITAFIGYTQQGPVDTAVHLFSFADFERAFGSPTSDSPLSQCVKHFFQNGGTEAYIVRVALNATAASVALKDSTSAGTTVLDIVASSEGTWGNNLRVDIDYDTLDPASLFNVAVTELIEQNGQLVTGRTETFRNLSLDSQHPTYAPNVISSLSDLIDATRPALLFAGNGTSTSGVLSFAVDFATPLAAGYRLAYALNGQGPYEITVPLPTPQGATIATALAAVAADVPPLIVAKSPPGVTATVVGGNRLEFTAVTDGSHPAEQSSIHFLNASQDSATAKLRLGTTNGGTEVDAAAAFRPIPTGTMGTATLPTTATGAVTIEVLRGATSLKSGIVVPIWGVPSANPQPTTLEQLVAQFNEALLTGAATEPLLSGATVKLVGNTVRVLPVSQDPNVSFAFTSATAGTLGLTGNARNVAHYAPGIGITSQAQVQGAPGNNGTPPTATLLRGLMSTKSGLYALEDVDLFNLLVIPDASAGTGMLDVLSEAIAYCERRRAFMIIDLPEVTSTFDDALAWMSTTASTVRSRNAALFFPRLRAPDPLKANVVGTFAAAGALAGLYARTDAERGVWKAPAGTSATISGATGLSYALTDRENGSLNPLALDCLRMFPVYGVVSWGARTGRGADALADEYKYVPVRRLALFLEESLYRGTQWVVFEPNDEPLWAQIRLNLGAFMHTLFAQGAFQGRTPRDAYFVKCDKETTTQNDIDLGRVNIVVGFAPLKPAEFVIIRIQQIAGAIQT